MKTITLDPSNIQTVRALHIYLQYMLDLPAYYGKNLDALHDVLGEIGEDTRLVLRAQAACGENESYMPRLIRVLRDAEQENPHIFIEIA